MGYAKHVGRVGALAVALGIGAAVATTPGVAWATEGEDGPGVEAPSNPEPAADPGAGATSTPTAEHRDPGALIRRNIERAADDLRDGIRRAITGVTRSSGGAITSTHRNGSNSTNGNVPPVVIDEDDQPETPQSPTEEKSTAFVANDNVASNPVRIFTPPRWRAPEPPVSLKPAPKPLTKAIDDVKDLVQQSISAETGGQAQATPPSGQRNAITTFDVPSTQDVEQVRPRFVSPINIMTSVLSAAIAPFLNPTPGQPAPPNPIVWAVLGWVRRQVQETPFGKVVLNREPEMGTPVVVDQGGGTFLITPTATDPDGDDLEFSGSVADGDDGTLTDNLDGTFTYQVDPDGWDQSDSVTFTVSDAAAYPHLHGLASFFRPDGGHTDMVAVAIAPSDGTLPPPPEVVQEPTQRNDGSGEYDTVLQYNPNTTSNVSAAPGFAPKYWTVVSEQYDPVTGKYTAVLKPTQAGQLRSALGLDTTDQLKLNVTGQQTVQTFALRTTAGDEQFGALAADDPDQALNLPDIPSGHFEAGDPILTSPDDAQPENSYPAGVVVTDRYAYVMSSHLMGGGSPTVSVIGADPEKTDYLQVIDEIPVSGSALLLSQSGDRVYVANGNSLQVIDIDGTDPIDESDDNALLAPISLPSYGGVVPVASPDGKKLYVIDQSSRKVYVVDTDTDVSHAATYHTVIDEIVVADPPTIVDNGDGTNTVSGKFPLSLAFNDDGTRMYVVRDSQTYKQNQTGGAITDFTFGGEIITVDTTTNEIIGTPVDFDGDYGYFASSDGKYLYVPVLTMNGFDPTQDTDISEIGGSINVIDVQDPDNPVVVANLPTGNLPVNVAFSPDKSLAYVVDAGTGTVFVVDTVNQQVLDLDPDTAGTQGLVFDTAPSAQLGRVFNVVASSPDGTRLFVTNFGKGTVVPLEFVQDDV